MFSSFFSLHTEDVNNALVAFALLAAFRQRVVMSHTNIFCVRLFVFIRWVKQKQSAQAKDDEESSMSPSSKGKVSAQAFVLLNGEEGQGG